MLCRIQRTKYDLSGDSRYLLPFDPGQICMVHQPSRRRTRSINLQYLPRSVFISTWISTAMLLAIFDISKAVENGVGITPSLTLHQDHIHGFTYG
ncbi:hypothetical protein C8R48DRAFT_159840 [Suillus tomentosus]|nr:hypothetical protein C8R48DRAFT_159840 [Suillus tomentosus]